MNSRISSNGAISNSGGAQPDVCGVASFSLFGSSAGVAGPNVETESVRPIGTTTPVSNTDGPTVYAPLTIVPIFGSSITSLTGTGGDPTTAAETENTISAGIAYYDTSYVSSVPAIFNNGSITNGVTVEIQFDYGTVDGTPMTANSGASQSEYSGGLYDFGQIQSLLPGLPSTDPTNGGLFLVNSAQEKMLGMTSGSATATDGYVGINSIANGVTMDYNSSNPPAPGEIGALGAIEREISEVFGRDDILGSKSETVTSNGTQTIAPVYSLLDLFRYSAPGTLALAQGPNQYFSLDDGATDLAGNLFNAGPGLDAGDWNPTAVPDDAFDATLATGTPNTVSALDQTVLTTIGFQLACFAEGTRVLTVTGPRPIESITVGDELQTVLGGSGQVIWVGRRFVDAKRHPSPKAVWPVRVARGAFGPGVPGRALFLSPDHAVFVDGVLIPAKLLVNGTSIAQVKRATVTYYHVELPDHVVILAEGLPVESYLDTGDRTNFGTNAGVIRLHPDFGARLGPDVAMIWEMRGAAPLVMTGPALVAAQTLIAESAARRRSRFVRLASQTG